MFRGLQRGHSHRLDWRHGCDSLTSALEQLDFRWNLDRWAKQQCRTASGSKPSSTGAAYRSRNGGGVTWRQFLVMWSIPWPWRRDGGRRPDPGATRPAHSGNRCLLAEVPEARLTWLSAMTTVQFRHGGQPCSALWASILHGVKCIARPAGMSPCHRDAAEHLPRDSGRAGIILQQGLDDHLDRVPSRMLSMISLVTRAHEHGADAVPARRTDPEHYCGHGRQNGKIPYRGRDRMDPPEMSRRGAPAPAMPPGSWRGYRLDGATVRSPLDQGGRRCRVSYAAGGLGGSTYYCSSEAFARYLA